ncbi:MAG: alkaline phosphatase family protein, partial [Methanosarcinales archaeon]
NGVSGELKSTIPPMTAPAWTSFMTGKNPGKHGIYHFIEYDHKTYDYFVVGAKDIHAKPIWTILSELNKKVGVMQVPMTYPPEKVNGFIVSGGLGTPGPESNFTYPSELREELLNNFNFKVTNTEKFFEGNEDSFIKDLIETEERKAEATLYLMKKYEWDFFMVMFAGTDPIQHFFWKDMDTKHPGHDSNRAKKYGNAILNMYQKLDGIVGDILKQIDDNTTVIIMSDHGFGPLYKELHLNTWLMENGLLKLKKKKDMPFYKYWLHKSGFTREMATTLLIKLGLEKIIESIPKKIKNSIPSHYTPSEIDWSETKAYSVATHGLVYINLKGRNRTGIVSAGKEYEELRDYIIKELQKLKDPETNKKIVDKVFKREDIYFGEYVDKAPDLFVLTDMTYHNIGHLDNILIKPVWSRHDNANSTFADHSAFFGRSGKLSSWMRKQRSIGSGSHRMNGIFIMQGKNIKKNIKLQNIEIIDIAPTILYLMKIQVPSDMDGKILKNAFSTEWINNSPVLHKDISSDGASTNYALSEEDEEKVKERLRNLGYL